MSTPPPQPGRARALLFLLAGVLLQTAAAVLAKRAALGLTSSGPLAVAGNPWFLASLGCLGLQALVWPLALRGLALSTAHALTAVQTVCLLAASRFLFGEPVSPANAAGAALIMAGVVTLGLGLRGKPA